MLAGLLALCVTANRVACAKDALGPNDVFSTLKDNELCPDSFKATTGYSIGILAFVVLISIGICIVTYALVFMEDEPVSHKSRGKAEYEPVFKNISQKHSVKKDTDSQNSLRRRNV